MNLEKNDVVLDIATGVRATTSFNATELPPPPPQSEYVPLPLHPSPQAPPPPETNEVLTDLVNLLCQHNDRHECVEKNHEKIPTVIATHIEESQRNKHQTTPLAADCATSTIVDRQRKGKKTLEDSDEGSRGTHPRHSEQYEPSKRRGERDSPPHHNRPKEGEYTLERRRSDLHKGPFTRRISDVYRCFW